jgi:hypothetical protein
MPGQRREWPLLSIVAITGFVAAQFLLVILMVVRQPYMYDIRDGWRWYHPLPLHAMTLFGLLWLLESLGASRDTWQERWALAGLALIIIANLIGWAPHRAQMEQGPWFGKVSRQSASLRESLRAGLAESTLQGVYRRFYFYCLESAPAILVRSRPQAGEGQGFYPAEFQGNLLMVASRRNAVVRLFAPSAGRYLLRGDLLLENGDVIRVYPPNRPMMLLSRPDQTLGPTSLNVAIDLPAGVSELRLESQRVGIDAPAASGRSGVAFRAILPFALDPI